MIWEKCLEQGQAHHISRYVSGSSDSSGRSSGGGGGTSSHSIITIHISIPVLHSRHLILLPELCLCCGKHLLCHALQMLWSISSEC